MKFRHIDGRTGTICLILGRDYFVAWDRGGSDTIDVDDIDTML